MNYYVFDGQIFKCEILPANSSCGTVFIKYMDGKQAHWVWVNNSHLFEDFELAKKTATNWIYSQARRVKELIQELNNQYDRLMDMGEKLVKMDSLE